MEVRCPTRRLIFLRNTMIVIKMNRRGQKLSTFDQTAKKGQVAGLWSKVYTLLVNVNTIIEACDGRKDVLNSEYYHVLKGEALALRGLFAFLKFSRVFGSDLFC